MAFFPLFVDPARHQGLLTFGVMALTIAALTFIYCVIVISITHFAADRMRASPRVPPGSTASPGPCWSPSREARARQIGYFFFGLLSPKSGTTPCVESPRRPASP